MIKRLVALGLPGSILAVAGIFLPWVKPNLMLSPSAPSIRDGKQLRKLVRFTHSSESKGLGEP